MTERDLRIDQHDSRALGITTLCAKAADGAMLFRQCQLGDVEDLAACYRALGEMLALHDADVLRSWEILVQRTVDELTTQAARSAHPRCVEHDCPVHVLHVTGRSEGKAITASGILDGSTADHARRLELLRSVALRVLEERGVTVGNHGHLYDDQGFDMATKV